MDSRLKYITKRTWPFWLMFLLVSCQDTIPQRSTITPGSTATNIPTCTEDQELVKEVPEGGTEEVYVCKDKEIKRPDNAVFWKSDFCACKDSKPISYGNCSSFCANRNTNGAETLFANFTVSEAISLGGFGSVHGWCRAPLPTDTQNPECEIEAKDEDGNISYLDVIIPPNSNSVTANIQDKLSYNKTYVLTLVERSSGVKSNSIQIIKFSTDTNLSLLGPLKNAPISQYSCLIREFSDDTTTGDVYYESAYRLHFYFIPRMPPQPIPAGNSNLICHDIFNPQYGPIDQELYPRFELQAGAFNLWDNTDPRFFDNNGNGSMDVDEIIVQKTKQFGGTIPTGTKFFQSFSWPGSPELETEAGNSNTTQPLGYFMSPWIDQTTFKSYCLNSSHYNSNNSLFKALRDIIQVDTEGLYIGEKAPEAVTDINGEIRTGFPDYILIRESDLKQVWFYLKNGVPTAPTDSTVSNNAIFFYYPLNKASPFVKTSTQRIFRVKGAAELNRQNNTNQSDGKPLSYPPHDRKIGCIPKF